MVELQKFLRHHGTFRAPHGLRALWKSVAFAAIAMMPLLALPRAAGAGDFDRNDLQARELAVLAVISPADIDPGQAAKCSPKSTLICSHVVQPPALVLRGTARRHMRQFYGAAELMVGATAPADGFSAGPWIGGGASIGLESATDGFRRLRWYGELGGNLLWNNTSVGDLMVFFLESGARIQVQQFERPHVYLHVGARVMNNFRHFGYGLAAGVGWTFD
jgi:hypothetical protein